jgi:hypothetical protein
MREDIRSRWQSALETLAVVVVAASVAWMAVMRANPGTSPIKTNPPPVRPPEPPLPSEPMLLTDAQLLGDARAPVALVIYSDFQCPYCGKFARETLPSLRDRYVRTGKVRLAFRQFSASDSCIRIEGSRRRGVCWPTRPFLAVSRRTLCQTGPAGLHRSSGSRPICWSRCNSLLGVHERPDGH